VQKKNAAAAARLLAKKKKLEAKRQKDLDGKLQDELFLEPLTAKEQVRGVGLWNWAEYCRASATK